MNRMSPRNRFGRLRMKMSKIWTTTVGVRGYGDCLERQKVLPATITSSSSAPVKKAIEDEGEISSHSEQEAQQRPPKQQELAKEDEQKESPKSFWPSQDEDVEDLDSDGKESVW